MSAAHIVIQRVDPHSAMATTLIDELVAELTRRYADRNDDESASFHPADATVPRSAFVIAMLDSEPVGCGALRPFADDVVEIKRMYVRDEARGRGVGGAIVEELERLAADFGYVRLILETGVRQPEAIALYTRRGFVEIAKYGDYDENPLSVCYGKDVARA